MQLPRAVCVLIGGILLTRVAIFMSYPFLALHLAELKFSSWEIGVVLGVHYLFAGIIGVFSGNLSDQWGAKRTILAALLIGSAAFFGLAQSRILFSFLCCNLCLAVLSATFEPAATNMITRFIPKDLHAYAFRCRYIAINIGASIGPCVGAVLLGVGSWFTFFITGILLLSYAIFFFIFKIEEIPSQQKTGYSWLSLKDSLNYMMSHGAFLFLIAGNLCINMTFCQIFSTLPQILNATMVNGSQLYLILLTVNPLVVILSGFALSSYLDRINQLKLFISGTVILSFSFLGFQYLPLTYANAVILMILFTIGELILLPTSAKFLSDIAPQKHRGAYLGSESCSYLGFFIGNLIGGLLLQLWGGVFLFCSIASLAGLLFYAGSYLSHQKSLEINE